jgi:hypothetical protein
MPQPTLPLAHVLFVLEAMRDWAARMETKDAIRLAEQMREMASFISLDAIAATIAPKPSAPPPGEK